MTGHRIDDSGYDVNGGMKVPCVTVVIERNSYSGVLSAYVEQATPEGPARGRNLLTRRSLTLVESARREAAKALAGKVGKIEWVVRGDTPQPSYRTKVGKAKH